MAVNVAIPSLGEMYKDYRNDIPGDSYNWGPTIVAPNVKYFAFHHSVTAQTAKNDGNWKAECDFIARMHIEKRNWGGIGYRFVICSDGTVAYVGDLSHGGSAVANNNDKIFSACMVGDFTKELPTAAQIWSAHLLAKHFLTQMPAYPLIDNWSDIIGHKDAFNMAAELGLSGATPTACPGPAWRDPNDALRDRIVNGHYNGYPAPSPVNQPYNEKPPVEPVPPPDPGPDPEPEPDPCAEKDKEIEDLNKQIDTLLDESTVLIDQNGELIKAVETCQNNLETCQSNLKTCQENLGKEDCICKYSRRELLRFAIFGKKECK